MPTAPTTAPRSPHNGDWNRFNSADYVACPHMIGSKREACGKRMGRVMRGCVIFLRALGPDEPHHPGVCLISKCPRCHNSLAWRVEANGTQLAVSA